MSVASWLISDKRPDRINSRGLLPNQDASVHDSFTRVRFTQEAHRELRRGIREPAAAGVECGGLLLGQFEHGLFRVRHAPVADKPYRRRAHSAELDLARCDELANRYEGRGDVLGSWHIHPNQRGLPWPSPADIRSWRSWLSYLGVERHLGVIVNQSLIGDFDCPDATGFVLTRSRSGKIGVETMPAELPRLWTIDDDEPVLMVAVRDRSWAFDGLESSFARGYTCWSDHPDAVDFPSAFVPVDSLDSHQRSALGLSESEQPARRDQNRDTDPNAPWNYRYEGNQRPTRLPGGWVRHMRPLRIGYEVWWERPTPNGGVETWYGDVLPKADTG